MKKTEWSGILVYIESHDQEIHPVSLELIAKGYALAQESGEKLYGAAVGSDLEWMRQKLSGLPIEAVFLYEIDGEFQADRYEEPVADCIDRIHPSVVLIGGTKAGRALAPRLAVEFGTGLTADCTELSMDEGNNLIQVRPAFGGNIMASILTEFKRPQLATVRPHIFKEIKREPDTSILEPHTSIQFYLEKWSSSKKQLQVLGTRNIVETDDIHNQDILVVAGRGIKKREDLDMLQRLAEKLGGRLASSRALVEKGWTSPSRQIGLSGASVSPKWMLTFGVSGTVQFMAGMKSTSNIIAVNTDPEARIFEIAHYPICADLYEVVPRLLG